MDKALSRQAGVALALGGAVVGACLNAFVFYPPSCGWMKTMQGGDLGTWLGAIASFLAVVVALRLAGEANRKETRKDQATAKIIASALCDELRGNRGQLEHTLEWRDAPSEGSIPKAQGMGRSLKSIHVSGFTMFKNLLSSLPPDVAHAVATAYASLARCRDVEGSMEWLEPTAGNLMFFDRYVIERGRACDDMLDEVREAITLLWPLTKTRLGLPPPLTMADERTFAALLASTRDKAIVTAATALQEK